MESYKKNYVETHKMRHCVEMKKNDSYATYIKCMAKIQEQNIMPEVKLYKPRKPRAKETAPRNQPEAEFRRILIPHLRRKSCYVMRIENSIGGRHNIGVADLIVFCEATLWGGFIELKAQDGRLSDEQKEFQRLCALCGIKYLVVRTLEEAQRIYEGEKCLT